MISRARPYVGTCTSPGVYTNTDHRAWPLLGSRSELLDHGSYTKTRLVTARYIRAAYPNRVQACQADGSNARGLGKGSGGFQCQMDHIMSRSGCVRQLPARQEERRETGRPGAHKGI